MPIYTIDTNPFFLQTELRIVEEDITDNVSGYIPLVIDDLPSEISMIQGFDDTNNLEVYKPGYSYNNFSSLNNDTLFLVCGRNYIIWSNEQDLPYSFVVPDCQLLSEPELPTQPPTDVTPEPTVVTPPPTSPTPLP